MNSYAVITDDAVQGITKDLDGKIELISLNHKFPFEIIQSISSTDLLLPISTHTSIETLSESELHSLFGTVFANYDEVFCILSAGSLSTLFSSIEKYSIKNKGRANFHLIDSESLSVGQGYLVNYVFQQVKNGLSAQLIDENLREMIPNIYTILCSPDLSYLYSNGFLDTGQLIAGEQHAIYPVFSLENGHYNSLEKFKNFHGIRDYFIEFLEEYENLQDLAFILPQNNSLSLFQDIKQYSIENIKIETISEVTANTFLSNLLGPHGFGMILIE